MEVVSDNPTPKVFRPFCNVCGWRKGGVDSWNGKACKCGHTAAPLDACQECAGDGVVFRLPHGRNPFYMRIEQIARSSRKMTCPVCKGSGLKS